MTGQADTLLIIPTHAHPRCLPMALESAQRQTVEDIDIVVIGDGVSDDTRDAMAPYLAADRRITFLDRPKAIRHGEEYRDEVIRQSTASIVTYLGDDDLMFAHHVATMRDRIAGVDFANPLPIYISSDDKIMFVATDLSNPASIAWHLDPRRPRNSVSLTGATHTRNSYLRLPFGWRPAPPGRWTDHYMWEQYFRSEGFTARTSHLSTTVKFPQEGREQMTDEQRAAEIRTYANLMSQDDFTARWNAAVTESVRVNAVNALLRITALESGVPA